MSINDSANLAHRAAFNAAEGVRQAAMAAILAGGEAVTTMISGPTGPTPSPGSARATRAANIAFHRACLASAIANGVSPAPYTAALMELGTGGQ